MLAPARRLVPLLAIAWLITVPATSTARAWGSLGHRVAARVAEGRLTPAAQAAIRELLDDGEDLADASEWPDRVGRKAIPESAPWHYVNVPITEPRYDPKFCQPGGCVVTQITHFRRVLANRDAPKGERLLALRFLAHLVEDIHQPLHVGDRGDKGGNAVQLQFFRKGSNLHRVWDSGVIEHQSRDERAWLEHLEPLLVPEEIDGWLWADVEDWANESLAHARRAYHFPDETGPPLASGARLDEDYARFAEPIIRLRLAQAGVRLAAELNAIFP